MDGENRQNLKKVHPTIHGNNGLQRYKNTDEK